MQDQSMLPIKEYSAPKSKKKKSSTQKTSILQAQGDHVMKLHEMQAPSYQMTKKPSKRGLVNEASALSHQRDKSSDSLLDSAPSSEDDYRALRRKYLLLEEESCGIGNELKDVEDEIKALEEEKLGLLDELVVLEGLIDPSEMQPKGHRLA